VKHKNKNKDKNENENNAQDGRNVSLHVGMVCAYRHPQQHCPCVRVRILARIQVKKKRGKNVQLKIFSHVIIEIREIRAIK
jgi:hypothetical protein